MAVNMRARLKPSLWNMYRHEIFKGSKQQFYRVLLGFPIVLITLIGVLQLVARGLTASTGQPASLPDFSQTSNGYDLGGKSGFALANFMVFSTLAQGFAIVIVIAGALSAANEYRWNTIKMLATRQPSRVYLILSKGLFALTLVAGMFVSTVLGWFIMGICTKISVGVSLEFTSADLEAMGKGLAYYSINSLQTFIMALCAVALTVRFKSVIAGLVSYVVYNTLDGGINAAGRQVINNGYGSAPDWMHFILDICKALNPFTLTGSIDRIAMREQIYRGEGFVPNPGLVTTTPLWWAWVMLGIYIALYTALGVYFFASRDITD